MSIPRSRLVAVLATAAVIPAAAVASGVASAQSGDTTTSSQSARPARGPGIDTAKLAAKLGVTEAQLKTALSASRPTGKPPTGDRGAGLAADLASALGVSTDKVSTILDANRPAKPAAGTKPAAGSRPDMSGLVTALSTGLGIDKATVQAAFDKLQAAHKAGDTARQTAMATALAKALNLDVAKVQTALAAVRPEGRA